MRRYEPPFRLSAQKSWHSNPARHDALVAVVSHVPHLTAASLMCLADERSEEHRALLRLAAGGFRDMTRVASGHPGIWPDICAENNAAIVDVLERLIASLGDVRDLVEASDRAGLLKVLETARAARVNLPRSVPADVEMAELRVPVFDRPGEIARITTMATDIDVNIYDLEIAHSAEGTPRRPDHDRRGGPRRTPSGRAHGQRLPAHARAASVKTLTVVGGRPLRGEVEVPGDKSISHRALILAGLAPGTSRIRGLSNGEDVARTAAAMVAMGTNIDAASGFSTEVTVAGGRLRSPENPIDVGNSGTAIRLLAGVCAGQPFESVLLGDASIARRPMDRIAEPLRRMGADITATSERFPPLTISGGGLAGIDYSLPVASAQVKGAVLLAGLFADGATTVRESVPTRMHTEEMLAAFGASIEVDSLSCTVQRSLPEPRDFEVAGDPSQAAFWVVAACLVPGSDVTVPNVYLGPARAGFVDVLLRMGADLDVDHSAGTLRARFSELGPTEIRPEEIPGLIDELPVLAVAAAHADGVSRFVGIGELRHKESDRVATIQQGIAATGGDVEVDGATRCWFPAAGARPAAVSRLGATTGSPWRLP